MANESTNLSCMLYGPRDVRYVERPAPVIEDPHDILVEIAYVGVCGSDTHFYAHGGLARSVSPEHPITMGHEASGVVLAVGSAYQQQQQQQQQHQHKQKQKQKQGQEQRRRLLRPGDRVALEPGLPCRRCASACKPGRYNLCGGLRFAADPPHHGFLTREGGGYRCPGDFAYRLPGEVSLREGVLLEPLAVAVHALRLAAALGGGGGVRPGRSVLVLGSGTIGLLVGATAWAWGARRVVVSDVNGEKLRFARGYIGAGAGGGRAIKTFVPDTTGGKTAEDEAVRFRSEVFGGGDDQDGEGGEEEEEEEGIDVVFECTGVNSSTQLGCHVAGKGATLVQVGMGKAEQTLPLMVMSEKELVLRMAFRYGPGDWDTALELLRTGQVSVKPLISQTFEFERAQDAWEATMRGEGIKNFIRVGAKSDDE